MNFNLDKKMLKQLLKKPKLKLKRLRRTMLKK